VIETKKLSIGQRFSRAGAGLETTSRPLLIVNVVSGGKTNTVLEQTPKRLNRFFPLAAVLPRRDAV